MEAERLFVPNHLLLPPSPAKESTPRTPAAPKAAARSKPQPGTRIILYSPQAVDERQDGDDEDFVHFMLVSNIVFVPWAYSAAETVVRVLLGVSCASGTRLFLSI